MVQGVAAAPGAGHAGKVPDGLRGVSDKQIFFEEIVAADRESSEKAKIDEEGVLVLAGAFKTDEMLVKYRLRYALNSKIWKLLGINVDTTKK